MAYSKISNSKKKKKELSVIFLQNGSFTHVIILKLKYYCNNLSSSSLDKDFTFLLKFATETSFPMQWCQYNFCNQTETILNIHCKNLACQDNFDEFYMKLASSTNNNHLSPKIKTVLGSPETKSCGYQLGAY